MEWKFHVIKVKKMKSAADADAQTMRLLAAWLTDSLSAKCLQKLQLLLALKFINNGGKHLTLFQKSKINLVILYWFQWEIGPVWKGCTDGLRLGSDALTWAKLLNWNAELEFSSQREKVSKLNRQVFSTWDRFHVGKADIKRPRLSFNCNFTYKLCHKISLVIRLYLKRSAIWLFMSKAKLKYYTPHFLMIWVSASYEIEIPFCKMCLFNGVLW